MPHHKWSEKQWLGMLFYLPVSCLLPVAEQGAVLQAGASQPASQPGLALVQRTSSKDYVKRERWENGTMSKENGGRTGLVQKENGESRTGTGTRTVN